MTRWSFDLDGPRTSATPAKYVPVSKRQRRPCAFEGRAALISIIAPTTRVPVSHQQPEKTSLHPRRSPGALGCSKDGREEISATAPTQLDKANVGLPKAYQ